MFVLKINSSFLQNLVLSHRVVFGNTHCPGEGTLHGCPGLGLHRWGAQPGRDGGAAILSPSLEFTDGTVFALYQRV